MDNIMSNVLSNINNIYSKIDIFPNITRYISYLTYYIYLSIAMGCFSIYRCDNIIEFCIATLCPLLYLFYYIGNLIKCSCSCTTLDKEESNKKDTNKEESNKKDSNKKDTNNKEENIVKANDILDPNAKIY